MVIGPAVIGAATATAAWVMANVAVVVAAMANASFLLRRMKPLRIGGRRWAAGMERRGTLAELTPF
jgi:hypothetical protein